MVTYRGYKTNVQFAAETSFASGGSVSTPIKGKISTLTINSSNNLIRTLGLGDGRNETFAGFGNWDTNWNMEIELASFEFLEFAIGSNITGSGTAVAPYYLKEADFRGYADGTLKTFVMEVASKDASGGTDNVETLIGCVTNTVGLTLTLGQTLKCSLEGFAQKITSGTGASAFSADTTKPWIFAQGIFKWNAAQVSRVTSATINVNNNFDPELGRELGTRFPNEMESGLRKYDWTVTVKMTSALATTMRDDFYGTANTPNTGVASAEPTFRSIVLTLSEGASSGQRNALISLDQCAINDISKPINIGDGLVELTINGSAKTALSESSVFKFVKWWTVP